MHIIKYSLSSSLVSLQPLVVARRLLEIPWPKPVNIHAVTRGCLVEELGQMAPLAADAARVQRPFVVVVLAVLSAEGVWVSPPV